MNIFFGILIGIFCLVFLVTAHELGHFIMARKNGVRVLEFGICFPPRAIAWKKGNDGKWHKLPKSEWDKPQDSLVLSLNWLPIGGFCQMDGESDSDTRKGTFGAATFWQKTKIDFGGVLMNWLVAFVIFTILAWVGMPTFLSNQFSIDSDKTSDPSVITVSKVIENSPADRAGFKEGDILKKVNGKEVLSIEDTNFDEFAGEEVTYEVERQIEVSDAYCDVAPCPSHTEIRQKALTATLNKADNEWGYLLGVSMRANQSLSHYTWSAPIVGAGTTVQITLETFKGLGQMLWNLVSGVISQISFNDATREAGRVAIGAAGEGVAGPIGIVGGIFPSFANSGFSNIAFLFALISVSLACMNVLPIPALDGGRWLMIFIARLKHKRLSKETEQNAVAKSMLVLLALAVLITILDITRFF